MLVVPAVVVGPLVVVSNVMTPVVVSVVLVVAGRVVKAGFVVKLVKIRISATELSASRMDGGPCTKFKARTSSSPVGALTPHTLNTCK